MPKIFVSYRRADSQQVTERIHDRLAIAFGKENVFLDVEIGNIPAGSDFAKILSDAVNECEIVVVVIGKKWLDIREADNPDLRRLQNPDDFVRIEVETSLKSNKIVLPVLVEGASPIYGKEAELLPDSLKDLTRLQFTQIRGNPDFHGDINNLIKEIKRLSSKSRASWWIIGATAMLTLLVIASFAFFSNLANQPQITNTPSNPQTAAAMLLTVQSLPTATATANETATFRAVVTELIQTATAHGQATIDAYTDTPSPSPTPSETPSITPTSTPNETATQNALNTAQALQTAAALALTDEAATQIAQSTLNAPTNTPRPTDTPTNTPPPPTATDTPPPPTATNTPPPPTPTPNFAATDAANQNKTATAIAFSTQVIQTAQANLLTQNAAMTQTFAALPPVTATARIIPTAQRVAQVLGSEAINLRAEPNTNSAVLELVSSSDNLIVIGNNADNSWFNVQLETGTSGWVRADLINVSILETLETAINRAYTFSGSQNRDWTPYIHTFEDGVRMALVPAGCFVIGTTAEQAEYAINELDTPPDWMTDEQPAKNYCFQEPFWIDETEVTQFTFELLGGQQANPSRFTGANLPVEQIAWYEAYEYCQRQGKYLPSEAAWEYAARGVESWIFPWGNNFVEENVVYLFNSNNQTASVTGRSNGASWVGARDMAGNVFEWTNSLYRDYPYNEIDGRENPYDTTSPHVLRGGSFDYGSSILRLAYRYEEVPATTHAGFRCARDIDAAYQLPTRTPTLTPTMTPTNHPNPSQTPSLINSQFRSTGRASVHESPDSNSTQLIRADLGENITAMGRTEDGSWIYVRFLDGATRYEGWVLAPSTTLTQAQIDALNIIND